MNWKAKIEQILKKGDLSGRQELSGAERISQVVLLHDILTKTRPSRLSERQKKF